MHRSDHGERGLSLDLGVDSKVYRRSHDLDEDLRRGGSDRLQRRHLALSLDHIGELVELRRSGDCGPVRDRLHDLVCARAGSARAQSAELSEFAVRLDELGSRLASSTIASRCGPSCACTTPLPKTAEQLPTALSEACTLPESDIPDRLAAWRTLFATAQRIDVTEHGHTVVLPPGPTVAARLAELAALEHDCCGAALRFRVTPDADGVLLDVSGPGAADALALLSSTS